MKYEHTLVLTAELSKIIDADYSDDLSERFAGAMKKLLGMVVDNVNVVRCQDFIRETNEEEDQGDWIKFDPEDKLTWPEMETEYYGKTVLAYSDDRIYLAYMDLTDDIKWSLTNEAEDVLVPIHCVDAWMPLPAPYTKEAETK